MSKFVFHYFNLNSFLPSGWQDSIAACTRIAQRHTLKPTSVSSREGVGVTEVDTLTVDGNVLKDHLPWMFDLYYGFCRDLVQTTTSEKVYCAKNVLYAVNLNIQSGNAMRYEAHVDTNPLQGVLYLTSHPVGDGGELVVSNQAEAYGVTAIEADSTIIYPKAGFLAVFDARKNPHYVRQLTKPDGLRISAPMNFYTPSCTENMRPPDLTHHLFSTSRI